MNVFFWFALIVLIAWIFFIYVLPLLLRVYLKKLSRSFHKHADEQGKPERNEGTVNIDYIPENHKEKTAPGDYVNYEEINEK